MELIIDQLERQLYGKPDRYAELAVASARAARGLAAAAIAYPANLDGDLAAIEPGDLTDAFARDVFAECRRQYAERQRIDVGDLYRTLNRSGRWDKDQLPGEVAKLMDCGGVGSDAGYFAKAVRKYNAIRGLTAASLEIANRIESMASEDFDPNDLAADVFQMVDTAVTDRSVSEPVLIEQAVAEAVHTVQEQYHGVVDNRAVPVGFNSLAVKVNSFKPGQLVIIGARPSVGKTALGIAFALTASHLHGRPVYFASLEMTRQEIGHRVALALTDANGNRIRSGRTDRDDYEKIGAATSIVKGSPFYVDDTPSMRIEQIYRSARRIRRRFGLSLVVIDYLQLVTVANTRQQRREQVEEVSRSLKRIARELEVPVIALAQLNREVEGRDDPKPKLSDIREAGGIEQDADIVGLLWRMPENDDDDKIWKIGLNIAKQRNGPTGDVMLDLHRSAMRFQDPVPSL